MDHSSRTYAPVAKSSNVRASQLAGSSHTMDVHEAHATAVTKHQHSHKNPHRKMLAHLGVIPERLVVNIPPNSSPNPLITQHVYSLPYVSIHGGGKNKRTITSLQIGLFPAYKTYVSAQPYSEMFAYMAGDTLETLTTVVEVDNTSITSAFIACYLVQSDPFNVWMSCNGPHEHFTFPQFETISPVLPFKSRWCQKVASPFDGTAYSPAWYSTNSNTWPLRPGPSRGSHQTVPLFVPPYTEPTAYWTANATTDLAATMLFFRTSPTIMQSWIPFTNGANLGIMFSGYLLRCGSEEVFEVTAASVPPSGTAAPRHVMEFVQGPQKYSRPVAVYVIGAGHNQIETHIEVDAGDTLVIVPSLKPIFTRGPSNQPLDVATVYSSGFDPLFTESLSNDLTSLIPGPVPADGSFQLLTPLNAESQQASREGDSRPLFSPWVMPTSTTVPQCVTGFTCTLTDYPLADGGDILALRCGGVIPGGISQSRSEMLPSGTYPTLSVQAIYFDG